MEGLRAQKYLNLCSKDEWRSRGFETTRGWAINDRIFIFGWTNPLSSYTIFSVWYVGLKLHIYALGTSETYFTSCKKGHNRSPLKDMFIFYFFSTLFRTHYLRLCKSQFVQSICISVFSTHNSVSFLSEKKSEGSYELQVGSRSYIVMAIQL